MKSMLSAEMVVCAGRMGKVQTSPVSGSGARMAKNGYQLPTWWKRCVIACQHMLHNVGEQSSGKLIVSIACLCLSLDIFHIHSLAVSEIFAVKYAVRTPDVAVSVCDCMYV